MIKAVAASIVLNIGFLVPLLDYIGDMHVSSDSWKEIWNFIQRKGEDGSGFFAMFREGNSTQAPDMILIFGMLLFLILLVCSDRQEGVKYRKIGSVTGTVSLLLLFMGTKYFPWDQIEICFPNSRMIVNSLQFPHRFYETGIVLMVITLCCGLIMLKEQIGDRSEYRTGVALIFCICLLSAGYILSNLINHESVTKLYNTGDLDDKWINTEEYLPEGAEPSCSHWKRQVRATVSEFLLTKRKHCIFKCSVLMKGTGADTWSCRSYIIKGIRQETGQTMIWK